MNIAIFGGSFDPPHIAHEQIAYKVLDSLDIDKLIIVPTYLNPFKKEFLIDPKKRLQLLQELFIDQSNIEISSFEVDQHKAVPSIQTVQFFLEKYSPEKIYLIIGSDNLEKLHLWKDFDSLKDLVTFVVISREGYEVKNDIIRFIDIHMDIDISSSSLKEDFNLEYIPLKIRKKVQNIWKKE